MVEYAPTHKADHDCGWLECGPDDCQVVRNSMTDNALIDANLYRDGTSRGLPECGRPGFSGGGCAMTAGHASNYHRRGGGVIYDPGWRSPNMLAALIACAEGAALQASVD